MDIKLESKRKHIDFLCDIEQILVQNCSLAEDIKRKEKDIHDLKKILTTTCQNGCIEYNKSMRR